MRINMVGAFIRNAPFGTEIAFKKGFDRVGGHTVTCVDPSYPDQKFDYGADFTMVFKDIESEMYLGELEKCGGKKAVYQPDDLRFPHIKDMMRKMRKYCPNALTFENTCVMIATTLGYTTSQKLLLVADDTLYHPMPLPKTIDACFIGSLGMGQNHASRRKMVDIVQKMGIKFVVGSEISDAQRIVSVYNSSKVVLNHATDLGQEFGMGYGLQCRHFEAGLTRSCVLSNVMPLGSELRGFDTFKDDGDLRGELLFLLANEKIRTELANELYEDIKKRHLPQHRAIQLAEMVKEMA